MIFYEWQKAVFLKGNSELWNNVCTRKNTLIK